VFDDCSDFISPDVRGECNSLPTTDDALNCDDFQTSDEATAFTQLFDSDDTNNLDGDNDGVSCEDELPTAEELEACGPPPGFNTSIPFGCTVVVTANPNVVMCGGQSLITATVRNRAGHVVPGFGFHFATDNGLLIVGPPNDAAAEQALAILQLFPPGSNAGPATLSSSVEVSVGLTRGITIHGAVLVQQQCSSSNTTAGRINLTASAPNVACGGRAFIAGTFKDVNGNPVPDDTDITFLASAGSVADEAVSTAATPTAGSGNKPSVKVKTKGGTANIIYTADGGAKGIVRITAASGASFGYLDLPVCAVVGGVTPPNTGTGVSIRPPNTGDGGVPR